ncbi:MAG: PAS domain-containing protein [Deltaproteobacteria bacterium]|nr:PAS domain-containing protein [Deltaproteobacteria bacterium]MBW2259487.1 PAS domain-containing protein [Deltaproteobacteria bacterium]
MADRPTYEELEQRIRELEKEAVECRQVEEKLNELRYYLDRITTGMYDDLMVIDRDFVIRDVNEGFLKVYGGSREDTVGRTCHDVTHGEDQPCLNSDHPCSAERVFRTGKSVKVEHVHMDRHGEKRNVEINAFPLRGKDGDVERVGIVSHDVTERKRADEERVQREKLQAVLELAGAVCHELNQPIQAISGHSELLLMDLPKDSPDYEKIKTINEQIDRMGKITRKLMEITRYETEDYVGGRKIFNIEKASEKKPADDSKDTSPVAKDDAPDEE